MPYYQGGAAMGATSQTNSNTMAFPWAAAAAGGSSLGGSIISASATQKANHDARNFALMQGDIEWQRENQRWARDNFYNQQLWNQQNQYNQQLWNQQNNYNAPAAQMERYREAGLNPNLIYGQSNMGGSVATANLESAKSGTGGRPGNWVPRVPDYDFEKGVMSYLSAREQGARTNNLAAQNRVLEQEAALKAATIGATVANTAKTQFELQQASDLKQVSMDAAKASLRKISVETDISLRRDARDAIMQSSNLKEAAQRMANMRQENLSKQAELQIKQEELRLKAKGTHWGDPIYIRALIELFDNMRRSTNEYSDRPKFEVKPEDLER